MARILLVDDDIRKLKMAQAVMTDKHEAIMAVTGLDGLRRYDEERKAGRSIDAVISDVQMPGISGTQMITKLREDKKYEGPIAIFSSTDVSDFFMKDCNICYAGNDAEACVRKLEKALGERR